MSIAPEEITLENNTPEQVQYPPLTQEERNDLRRKVLSGVGLTPLEARRVFETLRSGQAAAIAADGAPKRERKGKKAMSDEELNASLAGLGL